MTSPRIDRLLQATKVAAYPICIEKARLMTQSYKATEGEPEVIRRAKALAHVLGNIPIFINDGELLVGNGASRYMGVELEFYYGPWPKEEIDALAEEGWYISSNDLAKIEEMNRYWMNRSLVATIGKNLDDELLWPFMKTGMVLSAWKSKSEGSGGGYAESGMGLGPGFYLCCGDYEKVIRKGLFSVVREAEEELKAIEPLGPDAEEKRNFLLAVVLSLNAIMGFARRFAALANKLAAAEDNPDRKKELQLIAEACTRVPAEPARNFHEALQALWFTFLMINPSTTAALGRMDQYLYPFYRKDRDEGRATEADALELLQCLRIKDMELNRISGKANRQKNSGLAKWHNCTIGGVTPEGEDASNELTYLILEAAQRCPTPHHTITLRVHEKTPEPLLLKALETVKKGIGMPAFVGDKSYVAFLEKEGISLASARDYAMCGCLDVALVGNSRISAYPMFVVPMVLELTLNNGVDRKTGTQMGPRTGNPEAFASFEELMEAFRKQLSHFVSLTSDYNNLFIQATSELFPDPVRTVLMADPIKQGRNLLDRTYELENGAVVNAVGMINVADSLSAVKKLVFDDKKYSMSELRAALAANWEGHEGVRKDCLNAPKFGNGDDSADAVAAELYRFFAEATTSLKTVLGGTHKPTAISISSQWPGGAQTGATPEGRFAGECLADGGLSPMRGRDVLGPTGIIRSASKIDQDSFQATLLNMKFHPSALKTEEDLRKLSALIRTYFDLGGKHVQFNVVNRETLVAAKTQPKEHRDLVVRVAGYSAYFVQLTSPMQDEIVSRTELQYVS